MQITHAGIKEMEQSRQDPHEPTQHFPPAVSVMNFHGPVIGSPIQSGSPGAHQEVSMGDLDLGAVRESSTSSTPRLLTFSFPRLPPRNWPLRSTP